MSFTSQLKRNYSQPSSHKAGFLSTERIATTSGETSQPFIYSESEKTLNWANSLTQATKSVRNKLGYLQELAQNLFTMKGSVKHNGEQDVDLKINTAKSLPGAPSPMTNENSLYDDPVLHRKTTSPREQGTEKYERVRSLIKEHTSHKASADLINKIRSIPRNAED